MRLVLSVLCFVLVGCATKRLALSLSHDVNVPKQFRAGNFSDDHPGFIEGNSTVERYVNAYERGWRIAVDTYARNIDFDDPSPLMMSGWAEEAAGGGHGYADGRDRIEALIEVYGKQKVSDYLQQFRIPDEN